MKTNLTVIKSRGRRLTSILVGLLVIFYLAGSSAVHEALRLG